MSGLSRREALQRVGLMAAAGGPALGFAPAVAAEATQPFVLADLPPIQARGYGADPDLIHPSVPWPLTLKPAQRRTFSVLADLILPREGSTPGASEVGVVDVLDEWVSAPYPDQQQHRVLLLSGLTWLDSEAQARHGDVFVNVSTEAQTVLLDRIADPEQIEDPALAGPVQFFAGLRQLVVAAFYTSPEGVRELGYVGNVPIAGPYPGPSDEALEHLKARLDQLGLDFPS